MDANCISLNFCNNPVHGLMVTVESLKGFLEITNNKKALDYFKYMVNEFEIHTEGLGQFTDTQYYKVEGLQNGA